MSSLDLPYAGSLASTQDVFSVTNDLGDGGGVYGASNTANGVQGGSPQGDGVQGESGSRSHSGDAANAPVSVRALMA